MTGRGALAAAAVLLAAGGAGAQTFSPGKLGKAHAPYEGLTQCTKCHEVGKQIDGKLCLDCHKPIGELIKARTNFHGRQPHGLAGCIPCHHDHRGLEAAMSEWGGTVKEFDHRRTTWPVEGKHAKAKCEACHQAPFVDDAELKRRFERGQVFTWLGMDRACARCHWDEHRGQLDKLKLGCGSCHDANAWKPAPLYKHDRTYKLLGGHAKVPCEKCHLPEQDPAPPPQAVKAANRSAFVRYVPTATACNACHKDPHEGRFGNQCERCHTEASWHQTLAAQNVPNFHDKTRFPLKGLHRDVACAACHPRGPKGFIQLRDFPFAHCGECHLDAHFGQVPKAAGGFVPCQDCHSEDGFAPTRYGLEQHQHSRYPLTGAHVSTPCNECHKREDARFAPLVPPRPRAPAAAPRRTQLLDFTALKWPAKDVARCERCHRDVHDGRYQEHGKPKACVACHNDVAWQEVRFDHDKDSRFPLKGRHAKAACAACHLPAPDQKIIYRGTERRCLGCHKDIHEGQFITAKARNGNCVHCHSNDGFKPPLFVHGNPEFSSYELKGRHAFVPCNGCHVVRTLENGRSARWYRGVPQRCQDCHANVHAEAKR